MGFISPTRQQLNAFATLHPDKPVLLLNLLRLRLVAEYGANECVPAAVRTGRDAFLYYAEQSRPLLKEAGATIEWIAQARQTTIGPPDEQWSLVLSTRYASARSAIDLVLSAAYVAAARHRAAAVHDSRLIVCTPLSPTDTFHPLEWSGRGARSQA